MFINSVAFYRSVDKLLDVAKICHHQSILHLQYHRKSRNLFAKRGTLEWMIIPYLKLRYSLSACRQSIQCLFCHDTFLMLPVNATLTKGVLRTPSNIYDESTTKSLNYFRKKAPSQMFHWVLKTWCLLLNKTLFRQTSFIVLLDLVKFNFVSNSSFSL